ncbi:hypothetical protein Thimo_1531 [Thioflavicoccus mobilis 8321]|uniref:Sulfur globule protein CV1 n=1 Tax=Thioflavicoccus mobilis 8321 TaxID=765912 RepID=L0GYC7_9GAMM|nr:sulfur globule family protein [Thioflavicoccus mobilis]AGA90314.1 hypothetical protein Thimo_1531 [Thioflavicoccus mobilis 8321]
MRKILTITGIIAGLGLAATPLSASAWWNGGPGNNTWDNMGDFFGDGSGDFNMSMSGNGRGSGRGYNRDYYGYGPGGYWGVPNGYGLPYDRPYAGGYPYRGGNYPYRAGGYPDGGRNAPYAGNSAPFGGYGNPEYHGMPAPGQMPYATPPSN